MCQLYLSCAQFSKTYPNQTRRFWPFMCPCSGGGEAQWPGCSWAVRGRSQRAVRPVWGPVCSAGKGKAMFEPEPYFPTSHRMCRDGSHCRLCLSHCVLQLQNEIILCEPDFCENPQEQVRLTLFYVSVQYPPNVTDITLETHKWNVSKEHKILLFLWYFYNMIQINGLDNTFLLQSCKHPTSSKLSFIFF